MILHTGGSACGATSTRSSSSARAWLSASRVSTTPICWPSAPTRRTCGDRILSLILGSVETPHHPFVEKGTGLAGARRTRVRICARAVYVARPTPSTERSAIAGRRALHGETVVLARVPEGDLQHAARTLWTAADAVWFLGRHLQLVAGLRLEGPVPDLDSQPAVQHDPQLVTEPVVVRAGVATGDDRDEPRRGRLVERVRLRLAPRAVDDHRETGSGSARRIRAISIAARAASRPLLPCAPPGRACACARSSVARTSKMHAMPVSRVTSATPRAASLATRSKCAVSPRITAPRHTTASTSASARRRATVAISKAPGTQTTVTSTSATPAWVSACTAPSSNAVVTTSLNRATTTPTRSPVPSASPRTTLTPEPRAPRRGDGPSSRPWSGGSHGCARLAPFATGSAPLSRARSPRALRACPGYWSAAASIARPDRRGSARRSRSRVGPRRTRARGSPRRCRGRGPEARRRGACG